MKPSLMPPAPANKSTNVTFLRESVNSFFSTMLYKRGFPNGAYRPTKAFRYHQGIPILHILFYLVFS